MTLIVIRTNVSGGSSTKAVARYWRWTAAKHLTSRERVVELPTGGRLLLPTWSEIGGCLFATGFTEVRDQQFVAALSRAGDLFVDVGSNIGLYSITAGHHGARVAAFEPNPRAARLAERNMLCNGVDGAVHRVALSDHPGVTGFTEGDVGAHIDPSAAKRVVLARLDDYPVGSGHISILKVDAEGHDEEVLRGASAFLRRERPVVLVEIWNGGRAIREMLVAFGYEFFDYDWRARRLLQETGRPTGPFWPSILIGSSMWKDVAAPHDDRLGPDSRVTA